MAFRASTSILVHCFQSYYYEILRQKEVALLSNKDLDIEGKDREDKINAIIFGIQKKLVESIHTVIDTLKQGSRLSVHNVNDVYYIMTIFADEVFLSLNWSGAQYWTSLLIERQLFSSEVAGDKFFQMLDSAIENHNNLNDDVVYLYFMILSLGFKGKFRDMKTAYNEIAMYKDRLYNIFHDKPSKLFYPGRKYLVNDCYLSVFNESNNSKMPDVRFWRWCLISAIVMFISISLIAWFAVTSDLNDVLDDILDSFRNSADI